MEQPNGVQISTKEIYTLLLEVRDQVRDTRIILDGMAEKVKDYDTVKGRIDTHGDQIKWLWGLLGAFFLSVLGLFLKGGR